MSDCIHHVRRKRNRWRASSVNVIEGLRHVETVATAMVNGGPSSRMLVRNACKGAGWKLIERASSSGGNIWKPWRIYDKVNNERGKRYGLGRKPINYGERRGPRKTRSLSGALHAELHFYLGIFAKIICSEHMQLISERTCWRMFAGHVSACSSFRVSYRM